MHQNPLQHIFSSEVGGNGSSSFWGESQEGMNSLESSLPRDKEEEVGPCPIPQYLPVTQNQLKGRLGLGFHRTGVSDSSKFRRL